MTGTPGPICPECGIDAVAEHKRRQARGPLLHRRISPDWLVPPVMFLLLIGTLPYHDNGGSGYDLEVWATFVVAGGILYLRWLWQSRRTLFVQGTAPRLLVCAILATFPSWAVATRRETYDLVVLMRASAIWTLLTAGVWALTAGRKAWTLLALLGFTVLALGAALTIACFRSEATAHVWSPFSDPRPGQIYDQYPLLWDEVRIVGPGLMLIAAAVLLLAVILAFRERRRN